MTNRTHRVSRIGLLGVALTTLLSPAGILISSAIATTALVGGLALHAQRSTPVDPEVHPRLPALFPPDGRRLATAAPETILIEYQGENIPIVLVDDSNSQYTQQRLDPIQLASGNPTTTPANPGLEQHHRDYSPGASQSGNGPGVGLGNGDNPHASKNHPSSESKPTIPSTQGELPVIPQPVDEKDQGKSPETPKSKIVESEDKTPARPEITALLSDQEPLAQVTRETEETQRNSAAIPEPSVLGLMGLGLVAMAWMGRRQRALLRRA